MEDNSGNKLQALRQLFQLSILRARLLDRTGRREEAFAWLATNLRAVQKVETARGDIVHWYIGTVTHGMVQREIQRMVLAGDFSSADARMLIAALEETRPRPEGIADAIRFDHVYLATKALPNLRQPLLLKPHLTERLHADFSRSYLDLVDADWATLEARAPKVEDLQGPGWQRFLSANFAGHDWLLQAAPDLKAILGRRHYHNSAISVTQAAIALRRYELEHQALPPTLADLVPNYLPLVPADYYDRKEIRYAPEFRALWSTGTDGFTVTSPEIPWHKNPPPHLKIEPPRAPESPARP